MPSPVRTSSKASKDQCTPEEVMSYCSAVEVDAVAEAGMK